MASKKSSLVVLGHRGYIGFELSRHFTARGFDIIGFDRLTGQDITSRDHRADLLTQIRDAGNVVGCINCIADASPAPITQLAQWEALRCLDINLVSPLVLFGKMWRYMSARNLVLFDSIITDNPTSDDIMYYLSKTTIEPSAKALQPLYTIRVVKPKVLPGGMGYNLYDLVPSDYRGLIEDVINQVSEFIYANT